MCSKWFQPRMVWLCGGPHLQGSVLFSSLSPFQKGLMGRRLAWLCGFFPLYPSLALSSVSSQMPISLLLDSSGLSHSAERPQVRHSLHLLTSLFVQRRLHEAAIHTWDEAHLLLLVPSSHSASGVWSPSLSPSAWTWPVDSPLRAICDWVWLLWASSSWHEVPHPDFLDLYLLKLCLLFWLPHQKQHSSCWTVATSPGSKPPQPIISLLPSSFPSLHWTSWHKLPSIPARWPGDTR